MLNKRFAAPARSMSQPAKTVANQGVKFASVDCITAFLWCTQRDG
jgi:hypothetical protein